MKILERRKQLGGVGFVPGRDRRIASDSNTAFIAHSSGTEGGENLVGADPVPRACATAVRLLTSC